MYRVDVAVEGERDWATNALRFETTQEASDYASDLAGRWMSVLAARVVSEETPDREPIDLTDDRVVLDWSG